MRVLNPGGHLQEKVVRFEAEATPGRKAEAWRCLSP